MRETQTKGRLILKEIEFAKLCKRRVTKNNATSGKIALPKGWIGKEVYVVVSDERE